MKETKNHILRDWLKNIVYAISALVNSGETDNDVELTGELANDPIAAVEKNQQEFVEKATQTTQTRTRTPRATKSETQKATRRTTPRVQKSDAQEIEH